MATITLRQEGGSHNFQESLPGYLATCRDLHSIEFWRPKKEDQVARIGVMGGGLGDSGNARKKTYFAVDPFPKSNNRTMLLVLSVSQ